MPAATILLLLFDVGLLDVIDLFLDPSKFPSHFEYLLAYFPRLDFISLGGISFEPETIFVISISCLLLTSQAWGLSHIFPDFQCHRLQRLVGLLPELHLGLLPIRPSNASPPDGPTLGLTSRSTLRKRPQAISGHWRQSATFYLLAYPPMQILDVPAIKRPRIYNLPLKENLIKNSSRATKESRWNCNPALRIGKSMRDHGYEKESAISLPQCSQLWHLQ